MVRIRKYLTTYIQLNFIRIEIIYTIKLDNGQTFKWWMGVATLRTPNKPKSLIYEKTNLFIARNCFQLQLKLLFLYYFI